VHNQLSTADDGIRLAERDILYAPDYVINAGGIISVAAEYYGDSSEDDVRADVGRIKDRLQDIFRAAKETRRKRPGGQRMNWPTNLPAKKLPRPDKHTRGSPYD
jgi:glutamate dehydrogenase/leucine dehydrogenase